MTTRYRLHRGKERYGVDVVGDRVSVSTLRTEETFSCGTHRAALVQARALVASRLAEGYVYVQRPQDPDAPRMRPSSLGSLREHFQEHGHETFSEAISRGNTWLAELKAAGHGAVLEAEFGDCARAVEQGAPVEPSLLARAEAELGFEFPPSYRDFLLQVGSVSFLNSWWDATTQPERLVASARTLMDRNNGFPWRDSVLFQGMEAPRLLRVCDHHNGDDWFYICHFRDAAREAPLYLGYHDEPELHHGPDPRELAELGRAGAPRLARFEQWLSTRVDMMLDEVHDRLQARRTRRKT
ncbi:SMI1/KNR4 family protein [Myxococcus stipitatus]|uniref:SMI1/KNR4 family protein n=1 Tax=Myxococcus stipitatus TaxID=83455 RepID=UPI0030D45417